jgi:tRNA acetyltransferase TAN1
MGCLRLFDPPKYIVTCAAGQEGPARRELRRLLGEEAEARPLFMKGNLLLTAPTAAPERLASGETRNVARCVPVTVQAAIGEEPLAALQESALAAADFQPGDTFRVECKRRGQHGFASQEVQRQIGMYLEQHTPAQFRFEDPDYLVLVEIFQDVAFVGCVRREALVHKEITRMRKYAPGMRPLNRAEGKLREALAAPSRKAG